MPASGPKRPIRIVRCFVAIGGKADVTRKSLSVLDPQRIEAMPTLVAGGVSDGRENEEQQNNMTTTLAAMLVDQI
jgi:hypothetical protein